MSLYDDFDNIKTRDTRAWSSGIKLLQSQLQLKKAATTQPKREQLRRTNQVLAPVIDLKSKKEDDEQPQPYIPPQQNLSAIIFTPPPKQRKTQNVQKRSNLPSDLDWHYDNEYEPANPNEYEKVVIDLRVLRDRENELKQEEKEKKRERKRKSRFAENDELTLKLSPSSSPVSHTMINNDNLMSNSLPTGFAGRWTDEEDEFNPEPTTSRPNVGVAIAPPPSLVEPSTSCPDSPPKGPLAGISYGTTNSVAAKIMAKYGFKEGQGLGKKEQGMSIALQVEKTSKRGGRIIHEKEILMPPPALPTVSNGGSPPPTSTDPMDAINCFSGIGAGETSSDDSKSQEPTITEIMKTPSKVVLLRNMVGPGEVDEDLEPEVKDECNTKYGDVVKVIIFELKTQPAEESIRIFVEFKRIESAIKAVVDLNGRFFGGRNVKAGFYNQEKFANLQLLD